jgi:hypothetical protein
MQPSVAGQGVWGFVTSLHSRASITSVICPRALGRREAGKARQSHSKARAAPQTKRRQIGVQDGCTNPDGTKGTNLEPNHQHCNVMSIANVYLFRKLSTAAGGTGGRGGGGRTQCGEKSAVREKRCG